MYVKMAPRKRSVVWNFFKVIGEKEVQCLLCTVSITHTGHTTSMLRHLRIKHPIEFVNATDGERQEYDDQQIGKDGDQYCSVEVALEDGDSDTITTVSGAEIACAINGGFDAVKQRKQEEAALGDGPSTRKRSLIWTHYEHLKSEKCALCLLCMQKIQSNSNTSNLHRHLSKKHPEAFAQLGGIVKKPPSFKSAASTLQCSPNKADTSKPSKEVVVKEKFSDLFDVTGVSEEVCMLDRERELTEALRNSQKQEARALEQQRELLEMLRVANARQAAAERETIELLRRAQEEESRHLSRQREELQKEREDLQVKWKQLQQERDALELCRSQQAD